MKFSFTRTCLTALLAGGLTACGGGNGSSSTPPQPIVPGSPQSATTVVNVSDAPSDRLVSFEITIDSIILTKSDNSTVSVLSNPRKVEVTHLSGTTEPLVLSAIPQGTYISATIAVSAPEVVFINNAGQAVETEQPSFTANVNVPLSPPLVVGSGPVVLTFDLNAKTSVTIDLTNNTVTITPNFTVRTSALPAAGHEGEEEAEDGGLEHVIGQVSAVTANSFTIKVGQSGAPLTFAVNSSTQFEEGATLAGIVVNSLVRVEGDTQADGTLTAREVELVGAQEGQEAEGVITATSGNPVSSFTLLLQDGSGSGMTAGMLGSTLQVQIGPSTQFRVDNGSLDMSGWNLPQFSASSLSKAQRVEVDATTPTNGVLTANTLKLEQQALTGTVSQFSNSQFTLTVPSDSAFALLTGMTTVTIYTGKSAQVDSGVSLANGANVRVRGLLLLNPAQGSYVFVASRLSPP
jgi:Domain of unknown function (DUF5666)/Domain of unknown function (DUF4382)